MADTIKDLYIETVKLTNKVRMSRVVNVRKRAMAKHLSWLQEQILDDLNKAVESKINHYIDEALELAEEEL